MITSAESLPRYLGMLNSQAPMESQFIGRLADHENDPDATDLSADDTESENALKVVRELWGPGGPLNVPYFLLPTSYFLLHSSYFLLPT